MQEAMSAFGHKRTFSKTLSTIWLCFRCFAAIFRAGAAHVVLLGPVRIAQRTPDSLPDLGCILQMFSDAYHRHSDAYHRHNDESCCSSVADL
jgi:hypothetical protein